MGSGDGSSRWAAEQSARMLEAIRWNWDTAYRVDVTDGLWTAVRLDNGDVIEARDAEGLRAEIFRDYSAKPVPRDLPDDLS